MDVQPSGMGLFSRLFTPRTPSKEATTPRRPAERSAARIFIAVGSPLVKVTGTTTHRKDEARAMMGRHGQAEHGHLEIEGRLTRAWVEKINTYAVAVTVEGEPIGYLSSADSKSVDPRAFDLHTIAVQAFSEVVNGQLRVEAWAWLAPTRPEWQWSHRHRPPITSDAKAAQRHRDTQNALNRRETSNPEQARAVASGRVRGVHYLELIEPIKQAKRDGNNELALEMCYAAIEGAEKDRMGGVPAPAYTEHAAIVLRKLKRRDEEIKVLRRYLRWVPDGERDDHPFADRIRKVEGIRKREQHGT